MDLSRDEKAKRLDHESPSRLVPLTEPNRPWSPVLFKFEVGGQSFAESGS
jgi:hypothetical protein